MELPERIERVKSYVPVSDIAKSYGYSLQKSGSNWVCISPFKDEKTPSCYFLDDKRMYKCHSSGRHGDVIDFVMFAEQITLVQAVEKLERNNLGVIHPGNKLPARAPLQEDTEAIAKRQAWARGIWRKSGAIHPESDVADYLTLRQLDGMSTTLIKDLHQINDLAHPWVKKNGHRGPAMVAALRDENEDITGVQLLFLRNGEKAIVSPNKMTLGVAMGSMVKLFAPERVMGIAEGVENAIAASIIHNVPVWATCGSSLMRHFTPPKICSFLWIFADNDVPGKREARLVAERLACPKLRVRIRVPPTGDWNDRLVEGI